MSEQEQQAGAGPVERPVRPRVTLTHADLCALADAAVRNETLHAFPAVALEWAAAAQAEIARMRETLNFIATHFSSDWPERCQSNVLAARYALTSGPDYAQLECERLRRALHEIAEEWAGAECGEPVHAQEAYAIGLAKRMYALAASALRPNDSLSSAPQGASEASGRRCASARNAS